MKLKALITGASGGIGASIAARLSQDGFEVYGTSRLGSGTTLGVNHWIAGDFSTHVGINDFLKRLEQITDFDVLVNNAGINIIKSQDQVSQLEYSRIESINLRAPYQIAQVVIKKMAEKKYGRIIHIASIWSVVSKSQRSLYSTMKTGLLGMTRAMAAEWAQQNILINSISPGFVETELTKKSLTAQQQDEIKKQIPIKRFAQPQEIAEIASFLCSEKNTYLTGQNIVIDGGFTIV
jgi:3-oxoacyl-[acyl-carrier protein] reductase